MLPIYICDDEKNMRTTLEAEIKRQIMIGSHDMEITLSTGEPDELLDAVHQNPQRALYFLDV